MIEQSRYSIEDDPFNILLNVENLFYYSFGKFIEQSTFVNLGLLFQNLFETKLVGRYFPCNFSFNCFKPASIDMNTLLDYFPIIQMKKIYMKYQIFGKL